MENKRLVLQPSVNREMSMISNHELINKEIFVGGIGVVINERDLYNYFRQYGKIEEVTIKVNLKTGHSKGYGFVQFKDVKSADRVIQTNGSHFIANKKVNVKRAKTPLNTSLRYNVYEHSLDDQSLDDNRLFLGGLGKNIGERELHEYFSQFGEISDVAVKFNPNTKKPRGYGFVQYVHAESVNEVMKNAFHTVGNKTIEVKKAKSKERYVIRSKIFVGGLTSEMTEYDLISHFQKFGEIVDFYQPFDAARNQKKNYCFMTFKDYRVVSQVLRFSILVINGIEVDVKKARFNPANMTSCEKSRKTNERREPPNNRPVHHDITTTVKNVPDNNCIYYDNYGRPYTVYNNNNNNAFYSKQRFMNGQYDQEVSNGYYQVNSYY